MHFPAAIKQKTYPTTVSVARENDSSNSMCLNGPKTAVSDSRRKAVSEWHKRLLSLTANPTAVSKWHKRLLSPMAKPTAKGHMSKRHNILQIILIWCQWGNSDLSKNIIIRMMPILSYAIPGERASITIPSVLRLGPKDWALSMFARLKEKP